jgi:hypothetical protein
MTTLDVPARTKPGSKVSDDARIVELLIAAAEYAAFAMDRLIKQYDEEDDQLRKVFYELLVSECDATRAGLARCADGRSKRIISRDERTPTVAQ